MYQLNQGTLIYAQRKVQENEKINILTLPSLWLTNSHKAKVWIFIPFLAVLGKTAARKKGMYFGAKVWISMPFWASWPYGLVEPNHLIPFNFGLFFTNTASYIQPEEKLRTQSQRWARLPPGLRTLRWDRLGVFSYTKILLILFFKKCLFYPTWLGSILEKRVAETSEPALRKQFP